MKSLDELQNTLSGKKPDESLKLIWGWIKQDVIDLKTFKYLITYTISDEIQKIQQIERQRDMPN
jgi:hypothetical protein